MYKDGLTTILRLICRLNIQSEAAKELTEKILLKVILPKGAPSRIDSALNMYFCLIVQKQYELIDDSLIKRLNRFLTEELQSFLDNETISDKFQLDVYAAFQVLCCLRLEAPEIFNLVSKDGLKRLIKV